MPIEKVKKNSEIIERVEQFLKTGYDSNADFNSAFSEGELVALQGIKDRDTKYEYEASEVLFWVDRESYFDELNSWNGEIVKDYHSNAIEFLETSDQKAVFSDLVDLIRNDRIAPFLGAGVSKAAGYPLWREALESLIRKINTHDPNETTALFENNDYLRVAQHLFDASEPQLTNYITTTFRTKFDNDDQRASIPSIFKLLPRLSKGCIVTTNFDCLIEEVFKSKEAPLIDGYMHGIQQGHNFVQRLLKGDRCILKLHGDASQPTSYVFTEQQYFEAYGEPIDYSKQLPKALRQIYISNSLLFLGCSLAQDKTLELFNDVKESNQFEIPDHFAILADPNEEQQKRDSEDRLLAIKIRPIWYQTENNHEMATKLVELAIDVAERRVSL